MTIEDFARRHHLKTRRDSDGTTIVPGKLGSSHIYDLEEDGMLGVCILPASWRPKVWGHAKRVLVEAGCVVKQDGDGEGCAIFDPSQPSQVRLALKFARIRRRRELSEEQRQCLVARLARGRSRRSYPSRRIAETPTGRAE